MSIISIIIIDVFLTHSFHLNIFYYKQCFQQTFELISEVCGQYRKSGNLHWLENVDEATNYEQIQRHTAWVRRANLYTSVLYLWPPLYLLTRTTRNYKATKAWQKCCGIFLVCAYIVEENEFKVLLPFYWTVLTDAKRSRRRHS